MTRIAYVDHSYHERTRSTMFLPELLVAHGHDVDIFWDEAWIGGEPVPWSEVAAHDVVIMFQSMCQTDGRNFRTLHPNVVYVPMFDQFGSPQNVEDLSPFWERFQGSKILSFSTAVHALAKAFGIVSHHARYFPPTLPASPSSDGLHGFFWLRRQTELGWRVVRTLIGSTRFDSFHLHAVGDPGFPAVTLPADQDMTAHNITVSTWFERWADFDAVASRANVYFAPRLAEGIGQTVLEAMARGQCVIAADSPTMNEYIVHGVNGLLYEPSDPRQLDLSDVRRIGQEARRGVIAGRARWQESEGPLLAFILAPSEAVYRQHRSAPNVTEQTRHTHRRASSRLWHTMRSVMHTLRATVRGRIGAA
jgi:hypothetical protein